MILALESSCDETAVAVVEGSHGGHKADCEAFAIFLLKGRSEQIRVIQYQHGRKEVFSLKKRRS